MFCNADTGDKRVKILMAAAKVFAQKGFHRAKMEEIAHEADVGKGTVYEYFPSKQELFYQMFQAGNDFYRQTLRKEIHSELSLREKLEKIVCLHLQFIQSHKDIARLLMQESMPMGAEVHQAFLKEKLEQIDRLSVIFDEGIKQGEFRPVDTVLASRVFFGAIHAVGVPMIIRDESWDLEKTAQKVVNIILEGIAL